MLKQHALLLDPLRKSIANSTGKVNKTRDPASQNSLNYIRQNIIGSAINIHPSLATKIDEKEEALNQFKSLISNFKPKQSVLEMGIIKTNDQERISAFKETMSVQKESKKIKKER